MPQDGRVYRSNVEYRFNTKPSGFQGIVDNADRNMVFTIEAEGGIGQRRIANYAEVSARPCRLLALILPCQEQFTDSSFALSPSRSPFPPHRSGQRLRRSSSSSATVPSVQRRRTSTTLTLRTCTPLSSSRTTSSPQPSWMMPGMLGAPHASKHTKTLYTYRINVAAMYPNIILTNRLKAPSRCERCGVRLVRPQLGQERVQAPHAVGVAWGLQLGHKGGVRQDQRPAVKGDAPEDRAEQGGQGRGLLQGAVQEGPGQGRVGASQASVPVI